MNVLPTGALARVRLHLVLLMTAALGASHTATAAPAQSEARFLAVQQQLSQVQEQLRTLAEENRVLRQHQEQTDRELVRLSAAAGQGGAVPTGAAATPVPPPSALPAVADSASALPTPPAPSPAGLPPLAEGLRLWGYGEVYYSSPTDNRSQTQADLARAVFGIGYAFDDRTEFNSEYEVEHAVTSATDVGEFEVEQFYVDRRLSDALGLRAGLFLMPFGFLNEHHEPTNFYGMQRNFIETLIIPSTWREGGFNLHGDTARGFGWNVGLTTGFDLSKWNFTPQFPPYTNALALENNAVAPLQATHQELALANARYLTPYLALSYYGVPGLLLGGAISSGDAVPVPLAAPAAGVPRVTLWEGHVRWMPGNFDLSALYAHGSITNLASANAANPGSPNPIPSSFYGYFFQGAYALWQHGAYRALPFVRFERYNLGASYAGTSGPVIPTGLVPLSAAPGDLGYWPQNHDQVWTAGANFYIGPHLVVKGDYQWFEVNSSFKRFDLGVGVNF